MLLLRAHRQLPDDGSSSEQAPAPAPPLPRTLLALLCLATPLSLSAQDGAAQETTARETTALETTAREATAQEVTAEPASATGSLRLPLLLQTAGGEAPSSPEVDAVALEVGGENVDLDLAPPSGRRVTLYLDTALSSRGSIQRAADRLLGALDGLLERAELEIVVADPGVRTLLPATRRADAARNALERVFLTLEPEDALELLRTSVRADLDATDDPRERARIALEAAADESAMVRRQFDQLVLWLAAQPAPEDEDRVLVLVNDALGVATASHYRALAGDDGRGLLAATDDLPELGDLVDAALGRGWGLAAFARGEQEDGGLEYAPDEDTPVGFRLRFGGDAEDEAPAPERLFRADDAEWGPLVEATAGALLGEPRGRRGRVTTPGEDLLHLLDGRYLVEVPATRVGADVVATARRGSWTVRAPARVPGPAPRAIATARLRSAFLEGTESDDDLDVDASLRLGRIAGELDAAELRVDLAGLELPDGAPLRLSVAVHTQEEEISIQHYDRRLAPADGGPGGPTAGTDDDPEPAPEATDAGAADAAAPRLERIPLRLPPAADSVAVVVTDLVSGEWGLAFADIDAGDRPPAATEDQTTRAVRLLPLPSTPQTGRVLIRTETTEDVARVVYYLNGRRVGRRSRPPFDAELDLGDRARTSQLVVAALDRDGNELARDRMLINEPPQSFWVRITEPDVSELEPGPVEIEAQVRVPRARDLERVDFYWGDRLLETASEPPFRRTIRVPLNEPEGFVRVAATLSDGRVAEDVLVSSGAAFGDTIGVELVELYVVATDRGGKPVQGLSAEDFRVIEDGDPQTLESFAVAGDLPLTLGLAIDTSSSLFLRMPEVRGAARRFVRSMRDGRDRAFLVGFGSEPELLRSATGDLGSVERSIESLEPYGATAVWGAINLSLEQLETVGGRRALVVFYDGDDEDREREFERSLGLARRARLPVYLIVLNDEAARTSGRSLSSRSFANRLQRIARVGGGRVFFVADDEELDPIFQAISEELRSHYLLTYYPQLEPGGPLWRPVEVEVTRRGIDARTVEGRELEP